MMPKKGRPRDGKVVIQSALRAAAPRPLQDSKKEAKIKYAVRFADSMADEIAKDLTLFLPEIEATTRRTSPSGEGKKKQIDVNFSTRHHGLALGLSLKSVHIRETNGRYTHNMKRNSEELRVEATGYHRRQPYSVLIAVLFIPFDSCDDGKNNNPSSFGSWVRHLRPSAGRSGPRDEEDKFEKIFIGLYDPAGTDMAFFDVEADPPKNGRPRSEGAPANADGRLRRTLDYQEFLHTVYHAYLQRNSAEFNWDDGTEEPLDQSEVES